MFSFSIRIDQAAEEYNSLERQQSELYSQIVELELAVRELQKLSGMQGAIEELWAQRAQMQEEMDSMDQMVRALGRIFLYYRDCEKRIYNNGEQNIVPFEKQQIGVNGFFEIAGILSGF